jgi:hypothetical protein
VFGHDGSVYESDVVTKGRKNGFAPKKQTPEQGTTLVSRVSLLQLAQATVDLDPSKSYREHKQAATVYLAAKQVLQTSLGGWMGNAKAY